MTKLGPAVVILAAVAAIAVSAGGRQQPFKTGAKTVAVYATVTDRDGRLVPDLAREDFEVFDNGTPQPIAIFSNEIQPITVVMMLDRSGSVQRDFPLVQAAAEAFVRRLLPGDKARIGSFSSKVQIDPADFTNSQDQLLRIIRTGLQDPGPTPLWNAVDEAITSLLPQEGRRVVLVFTDGADSPMNLRLRNRSVMDVMDRAQQNNVMVYAIGLESSGPPGGFVGRGGFGRGGPGMMRQGPDPGLPTIAEETGGGYFELRRAEDLSTAFSRVAEELHRQYAIGFDPPKLDNKVHRLEVKARKGGMKVRARKNYRASP
jgi:Ca-activated chloride channel family protein